MCAGKTAATLATHTDGGAKKQKKTTPTQLKDQTKATGGDTRANVTGGSTRQSARRALGAGGKALQTLLLLFAPVVSGVTAEPQTTAAIGNQFYERFLSSV